METQPGEAFLGSALTLMTRWLGNMMRANGRALALGPGRIGLFTWWSILDQRVPAWTTLVGPISVAVAATLHTAAVIPLPVAWVMGTRYLFCAATSLFRGTAFPVRHPPLLYFSLVGGALVKTDVTFHPPRRRASAPSRRGRRRATGACGCGPPWRRRSPR